MVEIECFEEVHTVISTSFRHGMMATKKVRFFEISTDVFTATGSCFQKFPKERCINTSHHRRNLLRTVKQYTKSDFHFQDKRSFARDRSCGRGSRL